MTDDRFTEDMADYWRKEYDDWDEIGKSPLRFVQSLRRIGTDGDVCDFALIEIQRGKDKNENR